MWSCKYRGTTDALATSDIGRVCCTNTFANGTLVNSTVGVGPNATTAPTTTLIGTFASGHCSVQDSSAFIACATSEAYAAGVWTCDDEKEICTGQGRNAKCVTRENVAGNGGQRRGDGGGGVARMAVVGIVVGFACMVLG